MRKTNVKTVFKAMLWASFFQIVYRPKAHCFMSCDKDYVIITFKYITGIEKNKYFKVEKI